MTCIAAFIYKWQSLIGSIVGGLFAIATALVVASSAVRAARRTAASLLIVDMLSIERAAEHLQSLATQDGVDEQRYPLWVAEKLNWRRPQLSSSYDTHAANLVGLDEPLSAHLSLLRMVYSSLGDHLERIASDADDRRVLGSQRQRIPRSQEAIEADAKVVAGGLKVAGAHAACAAHLLQRLALSRLPRVLTRIRMLLRPLPIEAKSKELLRDGGV